MTAQPQTSPQRDFLTDQQHLWVVLPAYNEEGSIGPLLDSLLKVLDAGRFTIIVVNDGSTDGTASVVRGYAPTGQVMLIDQPENRGLAETLRTGLLSAVEKAGADDVVVVMDADNTHPTGLISRMIRLIKEGNDVVIASRYREGSYVRGLSLGRRTLSWGASILFRLVFPTPGVRDYTCGYRAYRAGMLRKLVETYGEEFISERGFACMVDILLRLRQQDAIFAEAPMVLRYDQKQGRSKMRVLRTVKETLLLLGRRRLGL